MRYKFIYQALNFNKDSFINIYEGFDYNDNFYSIKLFTKKSNRFGSHYSVSDKYLPYYKNYPILLKNRNNFHIDRVIFKYNDEIINVDMNKLKITKINMKGNMYCSYCFSSDYSLYSKRMKTCYPNSPNKKDLKIEVNTYFFIRLIIDPYYYEFNQIELNFRKPMFIDECNNVNGFGEFVNFLKTI